MRKLIIIVGFFGCFFCFYGIGAYLKTFPLSPGGTLYPLPPLVKRQLPVTVPTSRKFPPQQAKPGVTPQPLLKPLAKAIEEDKGAELIERLQAGRLEPFPRIQESVQRRFEAEYPRNEHEALKEAASRMSIVQAFAQYTRQAMTKNELQTITQVLEKVATSDPHPGVRREAWKALIHTTGQMDEPDRLKVYAKASRGLASFTQTPKELAEELFKVETP